MAAKSVKKEGRGKSRRQRNSWWYTRVSQAWQLEDDMIGASTTSSLGDNPAPPSPGYNPAPPSPGYSPVPPSPEYNPVPPSPGYNPIPPSPEYNPLPPSPGYEPLYHDASNICNVVISRSTTPAERDITQLIDAVDLIQAQVANRDMTLLPNHLLIKLQHAAQMILDASSTLTEGRVARMKDAIDLLRAQEATLKKLLSVRIPAATGNSPEGTPMQSTPVLDWQPQTLDGLDERCLNGGLDESYLNGGLDEVPDLSTYLMITHFSLSPS
ncbi:hypothetical protein R1sor_018081 [Riccia sorocarpa]|uniref:Uncharacterized protein n=1 Tax=Riccia sorocarpa TaxID=122646 RepID=A0ABD3IAF9_9MARC